MKSYIPNILTSIRILLVPVVLWFLGRGDYPYALGGFLIAGITDYIDGYLARRWTVESTFGRLADPLADKVLLVLTTWAMGYLNLLPLWFSVIVIGRDILILLASLGIFLFQLSVRLDPLFSSKLNTFCHLSLLGFILIEKSLPFIEASREIISFFQGIIFVMLYVTVATTFWSGIGYARRFFSKCKQS